MNSKGALESLVIVDLGLGMATALVARLLEGLGAHVLRAEPAGGDPFRNIYAAHRCWYGRAETLAANDVSSALAKADICLVGGESFPGSGCSFDAAGLAAANERLIVLKIDGYATESLASHPAVDLLVQARSGLAFEQFSRRPLHFALPLPTYGAAIQGALAVLSALVVRERTGRGQIVSTSLQQGLLTFISHLWLSSPAGDEHIGGVAPKDVTHCIFQCADGDYLQFVLGVPGALSRLYAILGIDLAVDPQDRGLANFTADPRKVYADIDLIAPHVARFRRDDLLRRLWDAEIAAEPVLAPGECWDDEQVQANGIIAQDEAGWRCVGSPVKLRTVADSAGATSGLPPMRDDEPPLAGVRVVDLGNFVAGPYSSRLLADLGAEVIKVEPPGGDFGRSLARISLIANLGKRSICIDAKAPDGATLIRRLCASADLVHHNLRVGVAERLGIDPASLRTVRPGIVTLESSAYGSEGPRKVGSGFDMIMQALCGHELRGGGVGNPPLWYRSPVIDFATGALGAMALTAALYQRSRDGGAVECRTSLLEAGIFLLSELIEGPDGEFQGAPLQGADQSGFHPAEKMYQASDGWVAVAARSDEMAGRFARCLDLDLGARTTWGEAEGAAIARQIAGRRVNEWLEAFATAEVWAEPCVEDGWAALCDDPGAAAAGLVVTAPDSRLGRVSGALGPLFSLSSCRDLGRSPAAVPRQGEHTRDILQGLELTHIEIEELFARGVVA